MKYLMLSNKKDRSARFALNSPSFEPVLGSFELN